MISVIIPIYNGEKYIENLFKMLEKQIYKDFEVILIDDGSTDNSVKLIEKLMPKQNRYRFYSYSNHGVSWARNFAMTKVKGDYFTFIDCDDYISEDYLNVLVQYCNDQIDAVFCKINILDENLKVIKCQSIDEKEYPADELLFKLLDFKDLNTGPCGKLINSRLINKSIKFPNLKIYEDLLFNIDLLSNNINLRVYFTNKVSYDYIQHKNSGSMTNFNQHPSKDVIIAMEYALRKIKNHDDYDYLFYRILSQVMIYSVNCSLQKDKYFIKETQKFLRKHLYDLLTNSTINKNEKKLYIIYTISFKIFKYIRRCKK